MVMEAVKHQCLAMTRNELEWLWHLWFGNLDFKDLSRLSQCTMVRDLPHIRVPNWNWEKMEPEEPRIMLEEHVTEVEVNIFDPSAGVRKSSRISQ